MDEDQTRSSYDHVAHAYAEQGMDDLAAKPFDRAILTEFARRVGPDGKVLDLGCGPGRVTRFLHDQGLDVTGIDLSPAMIEAARARFPKLRFEVVSMFALPYPDGSINGLVAMYSIIHIPAPITRLSSANSAASSHPAAGSCSRITWARRTATSRSGSASRSIWSSWSSRRARSKPA